jgi:Gpi18-like mannosyltransferase
LFFGDAGWYYTVVDHGYDLQPPYRPFAQPSAQNQANWAFFPLYPLFVKILGGSTWAGFLVSNVSAMMALLVLHDTIMRKKDLKTANHAIILLSYFPCSYHLSAFRPEGLFLLLVAGVYIPFSGNGGWPVPPDF